MTLIAQLSDLVYSTVMINLKMSIQMIFLLMALFSSSAFADEAILTIKSGLIQKKWTRTELLAMSSTIEIQNDPAYPASVNIYQAVSVKSLFSSIEISKEATLLFKCTDGFSAPISRDRLLNAGTNVAVPYIAIEPLEKKWPILKNKKSSAGPFYLVWVNPEKSNIGKEEWPFNLSGFVVLSSLEDEFPKMIPDPKLSKNHTVKKGFQVFLKNCFACHTMNGEGKSEMGPDLNLPHNPTEYLKAGFIEKLIRNPQNLRLWPLSKMSAFPESVISKDELRDLLSYLGHMAARKK
jgi:mono/diheme cytochrome c family protein